ncbi:hypothetical protein TNCV_3430531 [Trichonephila clavipes]|nr:hypothetical protein TNCV_3430531 [Trichonephila clavipes]
MRRTSKKREKQQQTGTSEFGELVVSRQTASCWCRMFNARRQSVENNGRHSGSTNENNTTRVQDMRISMTAKYPSSQQKKKSLQTRAKMERAVQQLVTGSRVFSLTCPFGFFGARLNGNSFPTNPRSKT